MIRVWGVNPMLLELCFCMTLHDDKGEVLMKRCWPFALVFLDVCFRMRLQDDTA